VTTTLKLVQLSLHMQTLSSNMSLSTIEYGFWNCSREDGANLVPDLRQGLDQAEASCSVAILTEIWRQCKCMA